MAAGSRRLRPATGFGELDQALRQLGLLDAGASARWTPLTGGVSSDIWRAELPDQTVCVKRARPVLAVATEWHAPVERNESEVGWLQVAGEIRPGAVPRVLGHLPDAHLFVMEHLDPAQFPVWKAELAAGRIEIEFAGEVGAVLGDIHARTAGSAALAKRFSTDELFHALRIEPYLEATALAHPDLAPRLGELAERTAATRLALVHGDVSPKNLLVGPNGPVFLDAECAWFGDPAFDVAFCLTHLLLKCRWVPAQREAFLRSFDAFVAAHAARVRWEPIEELDARVATLLPALLLARVDGKSPVEYLTDDGDRDSVRSIARRLLVHPEETTSAVRGAWQRSLSQ
jgi:aminoglycoside phosphotransferase (APT) family kinase protein